MEQRAEGSFGAGRHRRDDEPEFAVARRSETACTAARWSRGLRGSSRRYPHGPFGEGLIRATGLAPLVDRRELQLPESADLLGGEATVLDPAVHDVPWTPRCSAISSAEDHRSFMVDLLCKPRSSRRPTARGQEADRSGSWGRGSTARGPPPARGRQHGGNGACMIAYA